MKFQLPWRRRKVPQQQPQPPARPARDDNWPFIVTVEIDGVEQNFQAGEDGEAIGHSKQCVSVLCKGKSCICDAYSRPAHPREQFSQGGLRTDVPYTILRSHPDFSGTLPPMWEERLEALNPAWPEMSIDWILANNAPAPLHVDWKEMGSRFYPPVKVDLIDGIQAIVVYVKPESEVHVKFRAYGVELAAKHDLDPEEIQAAVEEMMTGVWSTHLDMLKRDLERRFAPSAAA